MISWRRREEGRCQTAKPLLLSVSLSFKSVKLKGDRSGHSMGLRLKIAILSLPELQFI